MAAGNSSDSIKILSVIIPVYNEEKTLCEIVDRVQAVDLINGIGKEIIVVDDGSTDGALELLEKHIEKTGCRNVKIFRKENGGKGSAVRVGFREARGEVCIVQDADLEYDPDDYNRILEVFCDPGKKALVVYGSRILYNRVKAGEKTGISSVGFYLGGRLISMITNLLYGTALTDEPTCYKAFRRSLLDELPFSGNGFEWEPEITARVAKKGIEIYEVPIRYFPRRISEGKKISWKDGLKAICTLVKYRFFAGDAGDVTGRTV